MKRMTLRIALPALFALGMFVSVAIADPGRGIGEEDKGRKDKLVTISHETSSESTSTEESRERGERSARCGSRNIHSRRAAGALVLRGTLVSVVGTELVVHVTKANRHGRSYVGEDVHLATDARTKFRRHGPAAVTDLVAGDLVKALVRRCKSGPKSSTDEATGAAGMPLLASRVIAKAPVEEEDDITETETTGTTTTTTT